MKDSRILVNICDSVFTATSFIKPECLQLIVDSLGSIF